MRVKYFTIAAVCLLLSSCATKETETESAMPMPMDTPDIYQLPDHFETELEITDQSSEELIRDFINALRISYAGDKAGVRYRMFANATNRTLESCVFKTSLGDSPWCGDVQVITGDRWKPEDASRIVLKMRYISAGSGYAGDGERAAELAFERLTDSIDSVIATESFTGRLVRVF